MLLVCIFFIYKNITGMKNKNPFYIWVETEQEPILGQFAVMDISWLSLNDVIATVWKGFSDHHHRLIRHLIQEWAPLLMALVEVLEEVTTKRGHLL